ncbi:MAG: hypothetical protein ACO1SV_27325 [Fimbriimonas sp.]
MSEVPPNYANYPRPNYQGTPYSRPPGVYVDVFSDAWKMVTSELGTWVLAAMITGIIGVLIAIVNYVLQVFTIYGGNFMGSQAVDPGQVLGQQIAAVGIGLLPSTISYMLFFGMANMAVLQARGMPITASDVFRPFTRFGPVFVATLLSILALYLGFIACIVPGIFLTGALSLASLIAMNQEVGGAEALRLSMRALGSQAWLMFVVILIGYILASLGALLCLVGMLFTIPLFAASLGLHYHYFFPPANAAYVPTADTGFPGGAPPAGPY